LKCKDYNKRELYEKRYIWVKHQLQYWYFNYWYINCWNL